MQRLLIVDDERIIADSLALVLGEFGYETTAVYNGEKAVEVASTLVPDVVISDVMMGEMNGIEAGIHIRQMLPACRVILFSGKTSTADLIERAPSEGRSFELLAKPVHPKALLAYLTGTVRGRSLSAGIG